MRGLTALPLLIAATACQSEPSFDERYNGASNQIEGSASNMQAELRQRLDASNIAEHGGEDPMAPPPVNAMSRQP